MKRLASRRVLLALGSIALASCGPLVAKLDIPDLGTARSVILAIGPRESTTPASLTAIDLDLRGAMDGIAFEVQLADAPARMTALLYCQPLADLGLGPGPLPAATSQDARPIAPWKEAFTADVDPGRSTVFEALSSAPASLLDIRIPSAPSCVERGGCVIADSACPGECHTPCPASPSPMMPAVWDAHPAQTSTAVMTPCPKGWVEHAWPDRTISCEPWQGPDPTCTGDQASIPGVPRCMGIGAPCTIDQYAANLPSGARIIYVDASALPGGTGDRASPLSSVQAAVLQSAGGEIIALAKGAFLRPIVLDKAVTIWGACPSDTTLTVSSTTSRAAILVTAQGALIKNLALRNGSGIEVASSPASALVESVVLERIEGDAVVVDGGSIEVESVVVREPSLGGFRLMNAAAAVIRRTAIDRPGTEAIAAGSGASLSLGESWIASAPQGLVVVSEGASVTASTSVFSSSAGTIARASDQGTRLALVDVVFHGAQDVIASAVVVEARASLEARRLEIEAKSPRGFECSSNASLDLADTIVRDLHLPTSTAAHGFGILLVGCATATLTRVLVNGTGSFGVQISGARAKVEDLTITDTSGETALRISAGSTVAIERARLVRNRRNHIEVSGASLSIQDGELRDLRGGLDNGVPSSISFAAGAKGVLLRVLVRSSQSTGISIADSDVSLTDALITRTMEFEGTAGPSLGSTRSRTRVKRVAIEGNLGPGITAYGGELEIEDLSVKDTMSDDRGISGEGIHSAGTRIRASRMIISRARGAALFMTDEGASFEGTDIVLEESRPIGCLESSTCTMAGNSLGWSAGSGVYLTRSATASLDVFRIAGNARAGVSLDESGPSAAPPPLTLRGGVVSGQPIGLELRGLAPNADPAQLISLDRVTLEGNGVLIGR